MPEVITIPANLDRAKTTISRRNRLRVAAYCRVSTEHEEQQSSFEAQQTYYSNLIEKNPDWKLVDIYADEGISGTSTKKRVAFNKMMRKCTEGKIDLILTKSISRFSRNTVDSIQCVRALRAKGIGIIFEKENIDTTKMDSEMLLTMLSAFAQSESESISKNVKWGKRENYRNGKVTYSFKTWYGYERGENNKPKIIPAEAEVVTRIFTLYLAGDSMIGITKRLNAEHVPPKIGTAWHCGVIQRMLKNEKYCGDALLQKTYILDCIDKRAVKNNGELPMYLVKDAHEGIVSREVFDLVQQEIARRSGKRKVSDRTVTENAKYSGKYALSELLYCNACGSPYRRCIWRNRDGSKRIVWRCIKRLEHGKKFCADSPTLDEFRIHNALLRAMNRTLSEKEALVEMLVRHHRAVQSGSTVRDVPTLERRINEISRATMALVQSGVKSGNMAAYEPQINQLAQERTTLEKQLAACQTAEMVNAEANRTETAFQSYLQDAPYGLTVYSDTAARRLFDGIAVVDKDTLRVRFKDGREVTETME